MQRIQSTFKYCNWISIFNLFSFHNRLRERNLENPPMYAKMHWGYMHAYWGIENRVLVISSGCGVEYKEGIVFGLVMRCFRRSDNKPRVAVASVQTGWIYRQWNKFEFRVKSCLVVGWKETYFLCHVRWRTFGAIGNLSVCFRIFKIAVLILMINGVF